MYCRERNLTDILKELWKFTTVQHRMILHDSLVTRKADKDPISPLFRLAREAVLLRLTSTNSQERLAGPLVVRLGENLPQWNNWVAGQEILGALSSYSGGSDYGSSQFCLHHPHFRSEGREGRNVGESEK